MQSIKTKRVYEKPEKSDGTRILVDRLWPRGVSKEGARVELWLKEIAPSAELRRRFCHDVDKWAEFQREYFRELEQKGELLDLIRTQLSEGPVTLLYAAKDTEHNNAVVLREFLERPA
ncbi:MAG: DUF488 domain-containing protein [Acidobacteria bacterium]|nr:MAG: DUF488 domain-containing protein [Acidobacteriota bacterium]